MNRTQSLRRARIAPLVILITSIMLAVSSQTSMAAPVAYSWRGTMEPLEANVDPWEIGAKKDFTITVLVNQDSLDLDASVVVARFDLLDAELLIDGVAQQSFDRGVILIEDNDLRDIFDIILFDVEFNGIRERFFTGLNLPATTISFDQSLEAPPLFSPTLTIFPGGAQSESSSYGTFVELDTTVTATVIPEPSTMLLIVFAALGVGIMRWRNRIR